MLIIQRYSVKITKIILLKHTVTLLRLGGYFEWRPWPHHEDLNTKIVNNPRSRAIGLNASRDCKCREPYRIKILLKVPSRREIRACHYCKEKRIFSSEISTSVLDFKMCSYVRPWKLSVPQSSQFTGWSMHNTFAFQNG